MEGQRHDHVGGISGLCRLIEDHAGALDYDLMTRTRFLLRDVPESMDWETLLHFVRHLDAGSALRGELKPDEAGWEGPLRTPMLLAGLLDAVNMLRWELVCMNTRKGGPRPRRPRQVPRPGVRDPDRKIGRQPIPRSGFRAWWDSR